MDQLKRLFASLSLQQKISLGVAVVIVLAALYGVANWRKEKDFKPLYTGMAPEDAAAVVQKVKESGSEYRLEDNGNEILVPSSKVAELRLELASAGLPKSGRVGFELFDKTNFGATELVEKINFNRALEGELERSIDSLSAIESARVHITPAKDSVFVEAREPGKASVIVRLRPGAMLFPPNVSAIQQLVSSAVDGVNPEDVSVVDTRGNLLSRRKLATNEAADDAYSYRERLEHDLVQKINGTLEPLLGRDRFHADAAIECDLTSSEQSEETYDPNKSVMVTSQKTEEVVTGGSTAGIPGTATNLPRPPARIGGPTSSTSRRTENITYESSHLLRKTHIPQGEVKRISVSVLLDQKSHWEGKGKSRHQVSVPASPEMVKAVHDLVAGVMAFSQERGDQITVESLPFESTAVQDETSDTPLPVSSKPWDNILKNKMLLGVIGGGALLLILGAVAGIFFLKRGKSKITATQTSAALKSGDAAHALEEGKDKATIEAANVAEKMQAALAERAAEQQKADMAALAALKLPAVTTQKTDLLTKEIRETTKKDPNVSAHVLQTWLHDS